MVVEPLAFEPIVFATNSTETAEGDLRTMVETQERESSNLALIETPLAQNEMKEEGSFSSKTNPMPIRAGTNHNAKQMHVAGAKRGKMSARS